MVAPDYAGLGANKTAEGEYVPHQYLANPAGANDVFSAVEAAPTAFFFLVIQALRHDRTLVRRRDSMDRGGATVCAAR